jgi:hypothetical protein
LINTDSYDLLTEEDLVTQIHFGSQGNKQFGLDTAAAIITRYPNQ